MIFTLKKWAWADIRVTMIGVAIMLLVFPFFFSPSAVVAGCAVAVVGRYLAQSGYSLFHVLWRVRLTLLAIFLLTTIVAGAIGTLIFGR